MAFLLTGLNRARSPASTHALSTVVDSLRQAILAREFGCRHGHAPQAATQGPLLLCMTPTARHTTPAIHCASYSSDAAAKASQPDQLLSEKLKEGKGPGLAEQVMHPPKRPEEQQGKQVGRALGEEQEQQPVQARFSVRTTASTTTGEGDGSGDGKNGPRSKSRTAFFACTMGPLADEAGAVGEAGVAWDAAGKRRQEGAGLQDLPPQFVRFMDSGESHCWLRGC